MVWTQVVEARPFAAWRVVCFPHAGGSPYFFRGWAKGLDAYEVHAVCYPGRAERFSEECADRLVPMAREIAAALAAPGTTGRSRSSGTAWARSSPTRWSARWRRPAPGWRTSSPRGRGRPI
ncbi:thioesterase II family protein [Streptomyces nojiriensis]